MPATQAADLVIAVLGHAGAGSSSLVAALTPRLPEVSVVDGLPDGASAAIFTVSSAGGLDPQTQALWELCDEQDLPRLVALTHLDAERSDVTETAALCARVLSDSVLTVALPVYDHDSGALIAVLTLLDATIHQPGSPGLGADPEHLELIAADAETLIEALLAEAADDALATAFLDGVAPDPALLTAELVLAASRAYVFPLIPVDVATGVGLQQLAELLMSILG